MLQRALQPQQLQRAPQYVHHPQFYQPQLYQVSATTICDFWGEVAGMHGIVPAWHVASATYGVSNSIALSVTAPPPHDPNAVLIYRTCPGQGVECIYRWHLLQSLDGAIPLWAPCPTMPWLG